MLPFIDSWVKTKSSDELRKYLLSLPSPTIADVCQPWTPLISDTLWSCLDGQLTTADATTLLVQLADLDGNDSKANISRALIDLISLVERDCQEAGDLQKERLIDLTKTVVAKNFVPVEWMKERWEDPFLESVGLNVEAQNFTQCKSHASPAELNELDNQIQDESDEPSTLPTVVDTICATVSADLPATSDGPVGVIPTLFVSFIGCLGLDPLQVLDGLLVCFTMHVLLYCGFFIKLLHDWTSTAGVADKIRVSGARLLSSKFKELNKQENAHKDATALYLTTAVLVKEKAIHIEEIYSQLSLPDQDLDVENGQWMSGMNVQSQSRVSDGLTNTTARAEDEAITADSKIVAKTVTAMEVDQDVVSQMHLPNQMMALLSACLFVGDTSIAEFVQKRFPRITATHLEIGDLINRIIQVKIQSIYDSLPLYARLPELLRDRVMQIDIEPTHPGNAPHSMEIGRFESVYPEWYTQLVLCSTLSDIAEVKPLLDVVGVRIHRNPTLMAMLCRLGAAALGRLACSSTDTVSAKAEPAKDKEMWIDMAGSLFLPAISLANASSGISDEVWQLLNPMSVETRVGIYRRWETAIELDSELRASYVESEKATKDVVNHITMEDVEESGPVFAVLAESHPLAASAAVMKQFEDADSFVEPLVSTCRHLSGLSLDVLSYAIVEHLSKMPPAYKVQRDGAPAEWMQKLGSFCGTMYQQQPKANLDALMVHLVDNICNHNARDLVVLKELLVKMGSAGDTSHLTAAQVFMLAGGEALREEAILESTGIRKDLESLRRLQEALICDGNATRLVLALARRYQGCQAYISQTTKDPEARTQPQKVTCSKDQTPRPTHVKATGVISDLMHAVLFQLVDFLASSHSQEYIRLCPSLTDLCVTHKIEPSTAMAILRPRLRAVCHQEQQKMALDSMTRRTAPEAVAKRRSRKDVAPSSITEEKVWLSSLESITREVSSVLPPAAWTGMAPEFYITFWQLSLGDIFVPEAQYRLKIQELKAATAAMEQDRRGYSADERTQRATEQDRLVRATSRLKAEVEVRAKNKMCVMERLGRENEHWFEGLSEDGSISEVIRHCIIPRAKASSVDALFCSKYLDILHAIQTPNFSRLTLYDKLFDEFNSIVSCATEGEARNFGVLLLEILQQLDKWQRIRALYEHEGQSRCSFDLPGFRGREPPEYVEDMTMADYLNHESFQEALYGWHDKIFEVKESQPWTRSIDHFHGKPNHFRGKLKGLKESSASAPRAVQVDRNRSLLEVSPRSNPISDVTSKSRRHGKGALRPKPSTAMNIDSNNITTTSHITSTAVKNQLVKSRDNNNKGRPTKDEPSDANQARGASARSSGRKRPRDEIDLRDPINPASKIARTREEHRIANLAHDHRAHNSNDSIESVTETCSTTDIALTTSPETKRREQDPTLPAASAMAARTQETSTIQGRPPILIPGRNLDITSYRIVDSLPTNLVDVSAQRGGRYGTLSAPTITILIVMVLAAEIFGATGATTTRGTE
ncbi:THO complex subunit 2 [Podila horticola]|nr:THO complex subunit 2 [Podila horticola]